MCVSMNTLHQASCQRELRRQDIKGKFANAFNTGRNAFHTAMMTAVSQWQETSSGCISSSSSLLRKNTSHWALELYN